MKIRKLLSPLSALADRRLKDPHADLTDHAALLQQRDKLPGPHHSPGRGFIAEQGLGPVKPVIAAVDLRLIAEVKTVAAIADRGPHLILQRNFLQIFLIVVR